MRTYMKLTLGIVLLAAAFCFLQPRRAQAADWSLRIGGPAYYAPPVYTYQPRYSVYPYPSRAYFTPAPSYLYYRSNHLYHPHVYRPRGPRIDLHFGHGGYGGHHGHHRHHGHRGHR